MDPSGAMVHVVAGMTIYLLFIRGSPKATALALTPKMDLRLTQVHGVTGSVFINNRTQLRVVAIDTLILSQHLNISFAPTLLRKASC